MASVQAAALQVGLKSRESWFLGREPTGLRYASKHASFVLLDRYVQTLVGIYAHARRHTLQRVSSSSYHMPNFPRFNSFFSFLPLTGILSKLSDNNYFLAT